MKKAFIIIGFLLIASGKLLAQGYYNHVWLLGSYFFPQDPKGRIEFDSSSYLHSIEYRKMPFLGTEATICNSQGDFLMSTNGIWIANSNNDTMMNGGGLNPNGITVNWPFGLPMTANAIFLPYPGDTTKYILFHHSAVSNGSYYPAYDLLYSIIDITGENGLGEVIVKNQVAFSDTLGWGIAACKHANGRDWWISVQKDNSDVLFTLLLTPNGIDTVLSQSLNVIPSIGSTRQLCFSPDGTKFVTSKTDGGTVTDNFVQILDFDRCSGSFSNPNEVDVSSGGIGWGLCFSPSTSYVYSCSSSKVYQIDLTNYIADTIASYDGYISPPGQTCCATSFWNMYLAANGKIYITSGSSVQHIHEMNYPDSAGTGCDLQQHAVDLTAYRHGRAVPNHPNYNLGPVVGSVCDTLGVGLPEMQHDFHFGISPNPVADGPVKIIYLLPENKSGVFEVYDITGQLVYKMNLPPWSTLQYVDLPSLSEGVYTAVVRSGYERSAKKLAIIR
ncbi:MAG: T9SS type A sorting domain-containing protein [Bacteroidia bacterium]